MCRCYDQILNVIFIDRLHTTDTLTTTILCLEEVFRHTLDITELCHGYNDIFSLDQFFVCYFVNISAKSGSSLITIFLRNNKKLIFDNSK